MRSSLAILLALAAPPVFVTAALRWGHDPVAAETNAPLIHREHGYVGSASCQACHPDHHASWARTFHATMTQRPSEGTVLGRFDGSEVRYGVDRARVFRDGERFLMEFTTGGGAPRTAAVALTVGSRRYQQYFETDAAKGTFTRLPILWHVALERWLPLETVFLGPDVDGLGHNAATWNENCILCHNTGPRPGMLNVKDPARLQQGARFDSEVGELGIACEACHGPGGSHAAEMRGPIARAVFAPSHVVDPRAITQQQALGMCGQCHGARLPEPIGRLHAWFTSGPTFRPGDDLLAHVTPIRRDTPVRGGDPEAFSLRFWGDGTARLTAYEYQGIVDSKCHDGGELTCMHCHTMHGGDPKGQLRPDRAGDAMCTQCHEAIARDVPAHTHHAAGSAGSACVACHMPKIVYGILDVHRSHRIDSPDAARDGEAGRPHACTLCHVDRPLAWAADTMRGWYGERHRAPRQRADGAPLELPDAMATLFAGDAAARAVAAKALGEPGIVFGADHAATVRAWLAVTMGDGYPSVRFLARRSLLALEERSPWGLAERVARVDHLAPGAQRGKDVFGLLDAVAAAARGRAAPPPSTALLGVDFRIDLPGVVKLTDLQGRNLIAIGE
jgi:predicted CXXCH cytochrome family protein